MDDLKKIDLYNLEDFMFGFCITSMKMSRKFKSVTWYLEEKIRIIENKNKEDRIGYDLGVEVARMILWGKF